jgi:hypothetical protein
LYERTGLSTDKESVVGRASSQDLPPSIAALLRDPYVLEFAGLAERPSYSEADLWIIYKRSSWNWAPAFVLKPGRNESPSAMSTTISTWSFTIVSFAATYVDLKIRPFSHRDAGQMNFYLNYFKQKIMATEDNPPVGVILCSDKDQTKVQFATAGLDNQLFVSRYLVALPSTDTLRKFVESDREAIESSMR